MADGRSESGSVTTDVLVAGSGAAGFAAALTARTLGLDVLMVEKEPVFGGTTAYSAGVIWIPGNHHQFAGEAADRDRADALAYLAAHVGNRLHRPKAEAFVANSAQMLAEFERAGFVAYTGIPTWADYHPDEPGGSQGGRSLAPEEFDGDTLGSWFPKLRPPLETMTVLGGMMVGRTDLPHVFKMTENWRSAAHIAGMVANHARARMRHERGTRLVNGNALVARLAHHAFRLGTDLWLESPIDEVIVEDGRVTGAIVVRDGKRIRVTARRGVVLACGGFPASDDLTRKLYPHRAAGRSHRRLPPQGNSGDGLRIVDRVGGYLDDNVHHPAAWAPASLVPKPGGRLEPFPHFFERGKPGYIAVDRRGRRFVNEAKSYHVFIPALIEACRGDADVEGWIVCDHRAIRKFGLGALGPRPMRIAPYLKSGYVKRGATPAELARACGIDPAGLEATIREFNAHAVRGEDPAFERGTDAYQRFNGAVGHGPNPCIAPLDAGPYYAVRVIPAELGTFAGIATNEHAAVVDRTGKAIPGLYAVGNDAASVMGGTYPGAGITIGPAMTFGYIAARHIAGKV
ncbi:MAG TPA: FAD-dependent oxidoreductase [Hyphomicrobiaceae bacterium]|nr:FAD-dependent oxidoreductase [Hyphomicrobiaceae bacterium]